MEADQVASGAAVVAVVVSILAVVVTLWLHNSAQSDQRIWELDQDKKRQGWAKDLQDRQNEWQRDRDKELREWEESLQKPKLAVRLDLGLEAVRGQGVVATWIRVVCTNTSIVPDYLNEYGIIILPDDRKMSLADLIHTSSVRIDFDPNLPISAGNSVTSSWLFPYAREQLKKAGYSGRIQVRGRYSDRLGNNFDSKPYLFDLDSDNEVIVPIEPEP